MNRRSAGTCVLASCSFSGRACLGARAVVPAAGRVLGHALLLENTLLAEALDGSGRTVPDCTAYMCDPDNPSKDVLLSAGSASTVQSLVATSLSSTPGCGGEPFLGAYLCSAAFLPASMLQDALAQLNATLLLLRPVLEARLLDPGAPLGHEYRMLVKSALDPAAMSASAAPQSQAQQGGGSAEASRAQLRLRKKMQLAGSRPEATLETVGQPQQQPQPQQQQGQQGQAQLQRQASGKGGLIWNSTVLQVLQEPRPRAQAGPATGGVVDAGSTEAKGMTARDKKDPQSAGVLEAGTARAATAPQASEVPAPGAQQPEQEGTKNWAGQLQLQEHQMTHERRTPSKARNLSFSFVQAVRNPRKRLVPLVVGIQDKLRVIRQSTVVGDAAAAAAAGPAPCVAMAPHGTGPFCLSDLSIVDIIGRGGFGSVYLGQLQVGGV